MGTYIKNSKHKKSIRAIQLMAYLTLLCIIGNVMMYIYYSLKDHSPDGTAFFLITFTYMLSCALHGAIGVSLPHSGKFEYYKPAFYVFILCDVIGVINGIKELSHSGKSLADKAPTVFYMVFFVVCFVCDIMLVQFLSDRIPRYRATTAVVAEITVTLLTLAAIAYSVVNKDKLDHPLSDKQYMVNIFCNVTYLFATVGTLIITRIKPLSYGKTQQ